jgi:hypothetical protein
MRSQRPAAMAVKDLLSTSACRAQHSQESSERLVAQHAESGTANSSFTCTWLFFGIYLLGSHAVIMQHSNRTSQARAQWHSCVSDHMMPTREESPPFHCNGCARRSSSWMAKLLRQWTVFRCCACNIEKKPSNFRARSITLCAWHSCLMPPQTFAHG